MSSDALVHGLAAGHNHGACMALFTAFGILLAVALLFGVFASAADRVSAWYHAAD